MSFRITFVLVVLAVVFGGYVLLRPGPEQKTPDARPWFYLLDDSKINRLDVAFFDQGQTYVRDKDRTWHFATIEGPAVSEEFRGTPFLAGGAKSPRIISQEPKPDLSRYGLDDSKISIRIHLEDGQSWRVLLGDLTADRINNYAQIEGFPDIYLVDRTWGEFMAKLITDPPHATPTPSVTTPVPTT